MERRRGVSEGCAVGILLLAGCYSGGSGEAASTMTDGGSQTEGFDTDDIETGGTASGGEDDDYDPPPAWEDPGRLGPQGLRRLTIEELRATLSDLVAATDEELDELEAMIPADTQTPYDNDYRDQEPSAPLIEGMASLSERLAEMIVSDPQRRDAILGCSPSGPGDEACLRTFIEHFGRLAFRRPLAAQDVDAYASFIEDAQADADFDVAFTLVVEAMLMDVRFLYMVEVGTPAAEADVVELDDYEMAARLAFLLWGRAPDDTLLDLARDGELSSQGGVQSVAAQMLDAPAAEAQLQRIHAMWLSYDDMPLDPTLATSLRAETDALVGRALQEGSWTSMFVSDETYLDTTLAEHYGIALPGGAPGWVEYPDIRRRGLLSHGSVLTLGKKFADTSPTERGKAIWTRMLCNEIPPPPPDVDSGVPPSAGGADACKDERYGPLQEEQPCATCHTIIDQIGFGLENYGPAGEWRTSEPGKPNCSIQGEGSIAGEPFAGAGALGELLVESGQLEACFMKNFYQYAVGRTAREDDDFDQAAVAALSTKFETQDDLRDVVAALVSSQAFRHRVIEEAQ